MGSFPLEGRAGARLLSRGRRRSPNSIRVLPRDAARDLFADVALPSCAVFAPTGRGRRIAGGVELTGRWAFTSGCRHAAVQACGMFVVDDPKEWAVMDQRIKDHGGKFHFEGRAGMAVEIKYRDPHGIVFDISEPDHAWKGITL